MSSNDALEVEVKHITANIGEVKSDIRKLRERMDGVHDTLLQKLDASHGVLLAKIDAAQAAANGEFGVARDKVDGLRSRIDAVQATLSDKIDAVQTTLVGKIDLLAEKQNATNKDIAGIHTNMEKLMRRVTVALFAMAATILGVVARGLHWI